MSTAFILAEFIGQDGSLGYRRGEVYPLIITRHTRLFKLLNNWLIEIIRLDSAGWCPYSSDRAFFDNWIVIPEGKYEVSIKKIEGVTKNGSK